MEETRMKRRRIKVRTEQDPQNWALTKDRWYNGVSKTILDVYHSRTIHRILMAAETARGRRGKRRKLWLRLRLYKKCIKLRERGLGVTTISKELRRLYGVRVHPNQIIHWVCNGIHPLGNCNVPILGRALAYCLGALVGDGNGYYSVSNDRFGISLGVTDRDFADNFGICLGKAFNTKAYEPWSSDDYKWNIDTSSRLLYGLLELAKEDSWILLRVIKNYYEDFLRGFFDAEGSADDKQRRVTADNANRQYIRLVSYLLNKLGIQHSIYRYQVEHRNRKPYIYVVYIRRVSLRKFAELVGFSIARKKMALIRMLTISQHKS